MRGRFDDARLGTATRCGRGGRPIRVGVLRLLHPSLALTLALALAVPARATWSIVVLNRVTGEVAVATSTCLQTPIWQRVPVVRVGQGAAAAQAQLLPGGINNGRIWDALQRGATPRQIIDFIGTVDPGFAARQFGVVAFTGPAATHTGASTGSAALGVVGELGPWSYAIQGNLLAGPAVILEAEAAFLNTNGDLGQRMLATMERARDLGGDGRCSCSVAAPSSCGAPPVGGFTHASYNVAMVIARHGDVDGPCNATVGCASGDYYFEFHHVGGPGLPEPIGVLRAAYDTWRSSLAGRPDHVRSAVGASLTVLRADGVTHSAVNVRLVDVDGAPLTSGGHVVTVTPIGDPVATLTPVVDHGNGSYSFDLTATTQTGRAQLVVVVDDGVRPVQLYPSLDVRSILPEELHAGVSLHSVSLGTPIPLVVDRGAGDAGRPYRVLASASGTSPGTSVGGTAVGLNRDRLFEFTLAWPGGPPFMGSVGLLDAGGRAEPRLDLGPGTLTGLIGGTLHFVALVGGTETSNAVAVLVAP